MNPIAVRAWWWQKQGLDGSREGDLPADILASTGWARSVGGAAPYLTLFARGGTSREAVEEAAAKADIHELPAARGCTYVVPACDYALALKAGQGYSTDEKTVERLGVPRREIDRLCTVLLDALSSGPLDPDGLREAAGDAVRHLGPEGAKKGVTTTMPVALGILQGAGEIRRIPANGRLDQQRYRYARWSPSPLADGFAARPNPGRKCLRLD